MRGVASHHSQVVDEGSGSDLFVERVFAVRNAQPAPNFRSLPIERQDRIAKSLNYANQPALEHTCLRLIAAMPHIFDTLPQFANGNYREIQWNVITIGVLTG